MAAWIRDGIVDGSRSPGSRLVERDLADEYGVSRIPVREALKLLDAEGIVTLRPRTWAVVREFTQSDVADLYEVRAALEVLAFRLAAQRYHRKGLDHLAETLAIQQDCTHAGDLPGARRAAADFHEVVVELAGNRLLTELFDTMGSRMRWLLGQHDDVGHVTAEHEALYSAIARRDVDAIPALVRAHLDTSRRLREQYIDGPGAQPADSGLG